ncbi:MAG TPA: WbqC family protein [Acidimicrobiales bacterium]|nr:WbqC family protein [Acidimicrobiales bacterium]
MRVAIHQPNFVPWLGLFDRIARVDRFVLFDHVQAMRGKSWFSRNRLLIGGEARWYTVPVERAGQGLQKVSEVRIDPNGRFPERHLKTLSLEYGRHPHFDETFELVAGVFRRGHERLADLNSDFVTTLSGALGLSTGFVTSTELARTHPELLEVAGNELVLRTCQAAGGDAYLSGDGCLDFIEPAAFEHEGVSFAFQAYDHPVYPQHGRGEFVSHLSVVDALCNVGVAGVRHLVAGCP